MPIITLLLFTFAAGVLVALAARTDLCGSPRVSVLSHPFAAFVLYEALVLVPTALYFYLFHGDWFLLYLIDTQRIPSALVLVACVFEILLGAGGFLIGAALVRHQRDLWAGALVGVLLSIGVAVIPWARHRLGQVGSYAQFHGDFGLSPFGGSLLQGVVCMSAWTIAGLALLAYRIGPGARRS